MQTTPQRFRLSDVQRRHRTPFDCIAMLVYLLAVHVWGLGTWPLGRDYEVLGSHRDWLAPLTSGMIEGQVRLFGGNPLPYQAVNLALLYGAMLCVYFATNRMLAAPRWFGTLAATLFMAHPVHLEAALSVTGGATDLLPAFLGVLMLALLLRGVCAPSFAALAGGMAAGVAALWADPANLAALAALGLHLWLTPTRRDRPHEAAAWGAVGMLALWGAVLLPRAWEAPTPLTLWAAYTLIYPLGLLPETTHRLAAHPWLFVTATAIAGALIVQVYRKVRKPAMVVGVAAALLGALAIHERPFDPYHLIGGGQLTLASFFAVLAVCAVFARMFEHPKWRRPTIYLTTVLCIVLFGMKISGIAAWRQAAREARAFQQTAAALNADEGLAVIPDWQNWNGAPLHLSKSISYDTPFSQARPHMRALPLNRPGGRFVEAEIRAWGTDEAVVAIMSGEALKLAPFPYALEAPGAEQDDALAHIMLLTKTPEETVYRIDMQGAPLPPHVLPARMTPEAGLSSSIR